MVLGITVHQWERYSNSACADMIGVAQEEDTLPSRECTGAYHTIMVCYMGCVCVCVCVCVSVSE